MQSFKLPSGSTPPKSKKSGFYRQKNYDINKYWKPGQPVTMQDEKLLAPVKSFFEQKGYTPTKEDIPTASELKARFRTWNNVLTAAGLPQRNDPENQKKRMEAVRQTKQPDTQVDDR